MCFVVRLIAASACRFLYLKLSFYFLLGSLSLSLTHSMPCALSRLQFVEQLSFVNCKE